MGDRQLLYNPDIVEVRAGSNRRPDPIEITEKLFKDGLIKHYNRQNISQSERLKSRQLANSKKISDKSECLLSQVQRNKLECFDTKQTVINLEKSVKYLNEIGLLKVFENMDKLAEVPPGNIHGRLRTEIRFVYQLWDAINTETVSLNTFMDILRCFTCDDKSVPKSINKMFKHRDQQVVDKLVVSWQRLLNDRIYYNDTIDRCESKVIYQKRRSSLTPYVNSKSRMLSEQSLEKMVSGKKLSAVNSRSNLTTYEKLSMFKQLTKQKLCNSREQRDKQEMKQCLFKPHLTQKWKIYNSNVKLNKENITNRLYNSTYLIERERLKEQRKLQKVEQQLQQCTFKPQLVAKNGIGDSQCQPASKKVRGYHKTIDRLRSANKQNEERKVLQEKIPTGENYEKLKSQRFNPPKFLSRQKHTPPETLFYIEFDLGKRKAKINITQKQTPERLAREVAKIYSLNKQSEIEMVNIIRQQKTKFLAQQAIQQLRKV